MSEIDDEHQNSYDRKRKKGTTEGTDCEKEEDDDVRSVLFIRPRRLKLSESDDDGDDDDDDDDDGGMGDFSFRHALTTARMIVAESCPGKASLLYLYYDRKREHVDRLNNRYERRIQLLLNELYGIKGKDDDATESIGRIGEQLRELYEQKDAARDEREGQWKHVHEQLSSLKKKTQKTIKAKTGNGRNYEESFLCMKEQMVESIEEGTFLY
jgi:hypothetical protein